MKTPYLIVFLLNYVQRLLLHSHLHCVSKKPCNWRLAGFRTCLGFQKQIPISWQGLPDQLIKHPNWRFHRIVPISCWKLLVLLSLFIIQFNEDWLQPFWTCLDNLLSILFNFGKAEYHHESTSIIHQPPTLVELVYSSSISRPSWGAWSLQKSFGWSGAGINYELMSVRQTLADWKKEC